MVKPADLFGAKVAPCGVLLGASTPANSVGANVGVLLRASTVVNLVGTNVGVCDMLLGASEYKISSQPHASRIAEVREASQKRSGIPRWNPRASISRQVNVRPAKVTSAFLSLTK
jgi:hypothetical protein